MGTKNFRTSNLNLTVSFIKKGLKKGLEYMHIQDLLLVGDGFLMIVYLISIGLVYAVEKVSTSYLSVRLSINCTSTLRVPDVVLFNIFT